MLQSHDLPVANAPTTVPKGTVLRLKGQLSVIDPAGSSRRFSSLRTSSSGQPIALITSVMNNRNAALHRSSLSLAAQPIGKRSLRILAPIDLAMDADLRIAQAKEVASALGAELTLLNVADPRGRQLPWPPDALDGPAPCQLAQWRVPETVADTIAVFAEFANADFILMTSASHRRWTPFWKAHVTDDVAALTDRPMLVSSSTATGMRFASRRILCALTLDGNDRATILQAESLARRSGGELILFSTVPDVSEGMLHDVLSGVPLSADLAYHRLKSIGRDLSVPYKAVVMTGTPESGIRQAAREYAADIVVANRRTLRPATSLRGLRCALLSVRGKETSARTIGAIVSNSLLARIAS